MKKKAITIPCTESGLPKVLQYFAKNGFSDSKVQGRKAE